MNNIKPAEHLQNVKQQIKLTLLKCLFDTFRENILLYIYSFNDPVRCVLENEANKLSVIISCVTCIISFIIFNKQIRSAK